MPCGWNKHMAGLLLSDLWTLHLRLKHPSRNQFSAEKLKLEKILGVNTEMLDMQIQNFGKAKEVNSLERKRPPMQN